MPLSAFSRSRISPCARLLLLAALICSAASQAADEREFEALYAKARANTKTKAGQAYDNSAGQAFTQRRSDAAFNKCLARSGLSNPPPFRGVLVLNANGTAQRVLVSPENKLSECYAKELAAFTWPAPPSAGYLNSLELNIRR